MAKQTKDQRLYALARRGAEARLNDIAHEFKLLIGLFPDLRDSFDRDELPLSFIVAKDSGAVTRKKSARRRPARTK